MFLDLLSELEPALESHLQNTATFKTDAKDPPESWGRITDRFKDFLSRSKYLTVQMQRLVSLVDAWTYSRTKDSIASLLRQMSKGKRKEIPTIEIPKDAPIIKQARASFQARMEQIAQTLNHEYIQGITPLVQEAFRTGKTTKDLAESLKKYTEGDQNKARFWARDTMGDAYSDFTSTRFKSVGIQTYVWMTSLDNRVRDTHAELHGKAFSMAEKPPGLTKPGAKLPGQDYNCRCRMKPIFSKDEALPATQQAKAIKTIDKERKKFGQPSVGAE